MWVGLYSFVQFVVNIIELIWIQIKLYCTLSHVIFVYKFLCYLWIYCISYCVGQCYRIRGPLCLARKTCQVFAVHGETKWLKNWQSKNS